VQYNKVLLVVQCNAECFSALQLRKTTQDFHRHKYPKGEA
jgi:hypothetical protein